MMKKGFSLVELALALVIIAILVGIIVKGKDLILEAKKRAYVSGFVKGWVEVIKSAEENNQDSQTSLFNQLDSIDLTPNDNILELLVNATNQNQVFGVFNASNVDLCKSIRRKLKVSPVYALCGGSTSPFFSKFLNHYIYLGFGSFQINSNTESGLLLVPVPPSLALVLDSTLDDGIPNAGEVVATGGYTCQNSFNPNPAFTINYGQPLTLSNSYNPNTCYLVFVRIGI